MAKSFNDIVDMFKDKNPPLDDASIVAALNDIIEYHNDNCTDAKTASSNICVDVPFYLQNVVKRNCVGWKQTSTNTMPVTFDLEVM
jgi:hypothetical protein